MGDDRPARTPKLQRRRRGQGGVICGLCAGIGEHLGVDPLLIRLGFVLAMFVTTGGLAVPLVYLLFSLFVPLADQ